MMSLYMPYCVIGLLNILSISMSFELCFSNLWSLFALWSLLFFILSSLTFLLRNKGPVYIYLIHVFCFGYVFLLKAFYAPWGINVALGKTQSPAPCCYLSSDWRVVWSTAQSCVTFACASSKFLTEAIWRFFELAPFFVFSPPIPQPPPCKSFINLSIRRNS